MIFEIYNWNYSTMELFQIHRNWEEFAGWHLNWKCAWVDDNAVWFRPLLDCDWAKHAQTCTYIVAWMIMFFPCRSVCSLLYIIFSACSLRWFPFFCLFSAVFSYSFMPWCLTLCVFAEWCCFHQISPLWHQNMFLLSTVCPQLVYTAYKFSLIFLNYFVCL